jgi:aldehyde dehydrogenase (NAD+)
VGRWSSTSYDASPTSSPKPAEPTPLCALATDALLARAAADVGAPPRLHQLVLGGRDVGQALVEDHRVALVSATGSVRTLQVRVNGVLWREGDS